MNIKKILVFLLIIGLFSSKSFSQYSSVDAEKINWRLAAQAWTFHNFTFIETLDKIKAAGITYVEMFPGQTIGGEFEGKIVFDMKKETRQKLLAYIQTKGLKLVNFGVVDAKDEKEWIQLFEFAKEMGIETIITEADSSQLNYIEPLCVKYNIKIALHNHPNPEVYKNKSIYWNPDFAFSQVKNRNKYIGLCPDLGHWLRSGLDPMESLKKYKGRILAVHAKDLVPDQAGFCGYHDVPWGTGISNLAGLMHELKNQGYQGVISLEYEYNWDNSLPEVKESTEYFYRLSHWLSK